MLPPSVSAGAPIVVAMSGGVDSSVAALLLRDAGYNVIGVTLKLYDDPAATAAAARFKGCCTVDDVEDARRVCQLLDVPHYVFNLQKEFRAFVIDRFVAEYQRGRTPHPCIACNDSIKFSFLMQRATALGASHVATGHYARIDADNDGGPLRLRRGVDAAKDQSYVLYRSSQEQLQHTLLPIGGYPKSEIRRLAETAGFPNAGKPDSQEICFIPMGDYREFIRRRVAPQPGRFVTSDGAVVGSHRGIEFYTIGQRKGLGIASSTPLYVTAINADTADITVGPKSELYSRLLKVADVNYIAGEPPPTNTPVDVQIRYNAQPQPATLTPQPYGALLRFEQPQLAATPGQAAVFYAGDEVIGGGRIDVAMRDALPSAKPAAALNAVP